MGRFMSGITTGALIGATIGALVVPNLDRDTRKRLQKSSKRVIHMAGDLYENMVRMSK
jgi:gas vesicle protein